MRQIIGTVALLSLIVLPVAWGYEQRRQARKWRNIVSAYLRASDKVRG